mmetsp:Transcript_33203/g.95801  ORF Transcript_33203/g.95801 Transcript_33203/m.95801 type:complete len:221 (+) Transcript_33203:762-1424(+)
MLHSCLQRRCPVFGRLIVSTSAEREACHLWLGRRKLGSRLTPLRVTTTLYVCNDADRIVGPKCCGLLDDFIQTFLCLLNGPLQLLAPRLAHRALLSNGCRQQRLECACDMHPVLAQHLPPTPSRLHGHSIALKHTLSQKRIAEIHMAVESMQSEQLFLAWVGIRLYQRLPQQHFSTRAVDDPYLAHRLLRPAAMLSRAVLILTRLSFLGRPADLLQQRRH